MGYIDGTSAINMLDNVFEVIEGGKTVSASNVVEFVADNGTKIADITTHEVIASNGAGATVSEVVNITEGATAGTTTGAGIMAVDLGVAGAGVATVLGLVGGVALYNLTPEFWDNIAEQLLDAGATVKGKVVAFMDKTGITSFPQTVIEIFKNAFIQAGVYNDTLDFPPVSVTPSFQLNGSTVNLNTNIYNNFKIHYGEFYTTTRLPMAKIQWRTLIDGQLVILHELDNPVGYWASQILNAENTRVSMCVAIEISSSLFNALQGLTCNINYVDAWGENVGGGGWSYTLLASAVKEGVTKYFTRYELDVWKNNDPTLYEFLTSYASEYITGVGVWFYEYMYFSAFASRVLSSNKQPNATYPESGIEFPLTYPDWLPAEFPEPLPAEMPDNYPVSLPEPDATQDPAQTGENTNPEQQDSLLKILFNTLPVPKPDILPDTDPSATPEPEPTPEPQPEPNPSDPNPQPTPSDPTIVLPTLDTVSASRMFTVYNPTDTQVNSLGAFLWTNNIIEQIKKLWENPMDGIISFHRIYGTPVTGNSKNIVLGYIDSGVSALEVTNQFCEVDCGTVTVPERLHNATDYSPFTSLHVYLPFVGIVELDTDECMNADLHIKYRIDVYTGTCVAMIYAKRNADMPQEQMIYTFSGNASQKLPLTASDFGGAISSLLSLAGAGVAVASGGSLGAVAGALGVAHSLTSEMVHVQHSGGLSANAGILTPRVPYLILSRQYGYDANGYNGFYGYPANKTVYIGNCNGYIKCKDVIFRGSCTEEEVNEINRLLKEGVYT